MIYPFIQQPLMQAENKNQCNYFISILVKILNSNIKNNLMTKYMIQEIKMDRLKQV